MSHDALFQLGMGSVRLNASQKEEIIRVRTLTACVGAICMRRRSRCGRVVSAAPDRSASVGNRRLLLPRRNRLPSIR